jgi:putative flippase GtrA
MVKKLMQSKVFRYFLSAGIATWVDILVYFLAFNYIYQKEDVNLFGAFVISAPTAALALSYTAGLLTNFFITKYIVFKESDLETHKQLFRYILVAMGVLVLNYMMMRLLIRQWNWFPTIARAFSAITVGMFSFVVHKSFSFKVSNEVTK